MRVETPALVERRFELGNGLGVLVGKVWRVGLMGTSCTQANVDLCIDALGALVPEASRR